MLFCQSKADPGIECRCPPATLAEQLRRLLDQELPRQRADGLPIIRETPHSEQGLYFWTPVEIASKHGVYTIRIRGSVWQWNGFDYTPEGILDDILEIRISEDAGEGSRVWVFPAFDLAGFEEHVRALILNNWGIDAPPTQEPRELPAADLPKTPKTLRDWREAYRLICELRQIYERDYKNFDRDDPSPTSQDCLDYVLDEMDQCPWGKGGLRTIQKIIKAGDDGRLTSDQEG